MAASIMKGLLKSTVMQGRRMVGTFSSPVSKITSHQTQQDSNRFKMELLQGDYVPVFVSLGLIVFQMGLGIHTGKQHLRYSPSVQVSKKRRETIPEVEDPDYVVSESDNLINKSFFRKIAHVQEFDKQYRGNVPDEIRADAYAYARKTESLKSVGVDPKSKV